MHNSCAVCHNTSCIYKDKGDCQLVNNQICCCQDINANMTLVALKCVFTVSMLMDLLYLIIIMMALSCIT